MLVMAAQTPRAATADGPRKPEYSVSCTIPLLVLPRRAPDSDQTLFVDHHSASGQLAWLTRVGSAG
jgi:hypothetical protein